MPKKKVSKKRPRTEKKPAAEKKVAGIRDRIVELRRVPAGELKAHPQNWRRHPQGQQDAMQGLLAEIGFAGAVLARETGDGLELIDGHLRAELAPDQEIPVLVLDVTEAEAAKLLATFDPVGRMAETDAGALATLMAEIEIDSQALQTMLDGLALEPPTAPFAPDLVPETSTRPVSPEDLERTQERLDANLAEQQNLYAVVCPNCASEFFIDPKADYHRTEG